MSRACILVVDDDADVVESVVMVLCDEGFDVVSAQTAADALAHARARRPSVILVDYHIPDTDTADLIARLKREVPRGSIVLCTADDVAAVELYGADLALRKPFAIDDLLALMRRLGAASGSGGPDQPPADA